MAIVLGTEAKVLSHHYLLPLSRVVLHLGLLSHAEWYAV